MRAELLNRCQWNLASRAVMMAACAAIATGAAGTAQATPGGEGRGPRTRHPAHLAVHAGVRQLSWGELPDYFVSKGFSPPAELVPALGLTLAVDLSKVRVELVLQMAGQQVSNPAGAQVGLNETALYGNLGYSVISGAAWSLLPLIGVGVFNHEVDPLPDAYPVTGGGLRGVQQQGVLNLSLGYEYLPPEPTWLVLGVRAGYLVAFDRGPWFDKKDEAMEIAGVALHDGPRSSANGIYVHAVLGVGF